METRAANLVQIKVADISIGPAIPAIRDIEYVLSLVPKITRSLKSEGMMRGIVVVPAPGHTEEYPRYKLITGFMRVISAIIAGMTEVPAYVESIDSLGKITMLNFVESTPRVDMPYWEIAITVHKLITDDGVKAADLANKIGIARGKIAIYMRMAISPVKFHELAEKEILTFSAFRELVYENVRGPFTDEQIDLIVEFCKAGGKTHKPEAIRKFCEGLRNE